MQHDDVEFDYKSRAVEYWRQAKSGLQKLTSVQSKFIEVRSVRMLYSWKKDLIRGGNRDDKSIIIHKQVSKKYDEVLAKKRIVHNVDIRRWALEANLVVQLEHFTASHE